MDRIIIQVEIDVAINRILVLQTRRLIEDSRRWLDSYQRSKAPKPASKECLLCGEEGYDLYHLDLQARSLEDFNREYPTTDLNAHLARFGVCQDCVRRYQGKRKRVIFALNRAIADETRVLQ